MMRRVIYLGFSLAALFAALAIAWHARAQDDPFGALHPPPGGVPAPSTRTGSTSVGTAVGRSYAGAEESGYASLAQMAILPKTVAPLSPHMKESGGKYLSRSSRIAIPTYNLALVRSGSASAFGGGRGSEMAGRRTSISTILVGVSDELAAQLADEAYQDLARRLTEAGFEVIPPDQLQADPSVQKVRAYGPRTDLGSAVTGYGPSQTPLRAGAPFMPALAGSGASMAYGKTAEALGAIVLSPGLRIDYQQLESSGRRTYSGSASVGAKVRFSMGQGSGAYLIVTPPPPYRGGWPSSIVMDQPIGSDEPFGIMYEVDDRSDSAGLHNAFASAGLGSLYRQSKYYAVEVEPNRYAALVRAAFQGLNASIVSELKKARAG